MTYSALKMYEDNTHYPQISDSIMSHLKTYSDTSLKKSDRIEVIAKAIPVLENVCLILRKTSEPTGQIMYNGFNIILAKAIKAKINDGVLQDFKKEISFLEIISAAS